MYLENHDHSVKTFVDLKHVSIVDLVRKNNVFGNETYVLAFLPVTCWATLLTGFAIQCCLIQFLGNILQDSIHVVFAQEEFTDRVDLVKNLLEPDFVG